MYLCNVCLDYARERLQESRIITSNGSNDNMVYTERKPRNGIVYIMSVS